MTSVTAAVTPSKSGIIRIGEVARWIAAIPTIETLQIPDWNDYGDTAFPSINKFKNVKALTISGRGTADSRASILINNCPRLETLSLEHFDTLNPPGSFDVLLSSLENFFDRLTSLSITCHSDRVHYGSSLSNFILLRELSLDVAEITLPLHQAILQLVNLEKLEIGSENHRWNDLLQLVQGPTRLLNLRFLNLNQQEACHGRLFDPDDSLHVSLLSEGKYELLEDGWSLESQELLRVEYWEGCKIFMEATPGGRLELGGTVFAYRRVFLLYFLELNNLAIAEAYFRRRFQGITRARAEAARVGLDLPELDFDSLYPELVKVEVLGWFALVLKDKDDNGDQ